MNDREYLIHDRPLKAIVIFTLSSSEDISAKGRLLQWGHQVRW